MHWNSRLCDAIVSIRLRSSEHWTPCTACELTQLHCSVRGSTDSAPCLPIKHLLARFHLQPVHIVLMGTRRLNIYYCSAKKWATECQRYFGDSKDITDVFQDYESLVEFLISSGHFPPPSLGSVWQARHDNNNNNIIDEKYTNQYHQGVQDSAGRYTCKTSSLVALLSCAPDRTLNTL